MTGASVIEVVRELERGGVVVWLDGGWGIDALLGRETRTHADLDLVIDRDQLPTARRLLGGLGFTDVPDAQSRVVLCDPRRGEVDFHLVVFDSDGNGWQQLGANAWGAYPANGLTGEGSVAGEAVRCLTAELQVRHHLGYEWDSHDQQDMRLLTDHFGVALPPTGDSQLAGAEFYDQPEVAVGGVDVEGCLACDLSAGRVPLPGGRLAESRGWIIEHCVGPLGVGTLVVKPKRHVVHVWELTHAESSELGPLLQAAASAVAALFEPDQVYVELWSHAGGVPGHIHFVVLPVTRDLMENLGVYGPQIAVKLFEEGLPPDMEGVERIAPQLCALLDATRTLPSGAKSQEGENGPEL